MSKLQETIQFHKEFQPQLNKVAHHISSHQWEVLRDENLTRDEVKDLIHHFLITDGVTKPLDWLYSLFNPVEMMHTVKL